jgi:hypothetical protein
MKFDFYLITLQISYLIPSKVNILPYYSNVNMFLLIIIHFLQITKPKQIKLTTDNKRSKVLNPMYIIK